MLSENRVAGQFMQQLTRERTHSFDKNTEIDCRGWLKFVIVEETYRYHRIRFTEFDPSVVENTIPARGENPHTT